MLDWGHTHKHTLFDLDYLYKKQTPIPTNVVNILPGPFTSTAIHDSSSYATGRPVVFTETDTNAVYIYNNQNDGLGTFTQVPQTLPTQYGM
jgi:hypothetical protein